MEWPPLVINLKQHIVGRKVAEYCAMLASLTVQYDVSVAVCVPVADLGRAHTVLEKVPHRILLFSQKVDAVSEGDSKTGSVCVDSIIGAADGTLLNHYETRIYGLTSPRQKEEELISTVHKAHINGLCILVCVDCAEATARIAPRLPQRCAIAVEWDAFIGQRISMIREKRDELLKAIETVKKINPNIPVYAGAGIEEPDDIIEFLRMGGAGVLAASAFTKALRYEGDYALAIGDALKKLKAAKI